MIKKSVIPAEIDQRRITIFLALAFLIAWLTSLVVYLTGGLANSPVIFPGGRTLAVVLLAIPYLWAPAIAAILTRLITGEGLNNLGLRLNFARAGDCGWPHGFCPGC